MPLSQEFASPFIVVIIYAGLCAFSSPTVSDEALSSSGFLIGPVSSEFSFFMPCSLWISDVIRMKSP